MCAAWLLEALGQKHMHVEYGGWPFVFVPGMANYSGPPDKKKFEGTVPHLNKSKLRTGLKNVKLHRMLIRIKTDYKVFRIDSDYGIPVAI
jgi:hypothetical protein